MLLLKEVQTKMIPFAVLWGEMVLQTGVKKRLQQIYEPTDYSSNRRGFSFID
jgi:hypothetical protein